MKPAAFAYHAPTSRPQLLELLSGLDNARLLAGGQSLMAAMNMRLATPDHLIDLNGVPGLDGVRVDGDRLRIGAMTRQRELELSPLVRRVCPLLAEAVTHVGFQQTRNRGTIGGSIANRAPTAEILVATLANDATLVIDSLRGERRMLLGEFLRDGLAVDELLVGVELPLWPERHGWAFEELTWRGQSHTILAVAALVELDDAGRLARSSIAIGGLGAAPVRCSAGEGLLIGREPVPDLIGMAGAAAAAMPADDDRIASAGYRKHLAHVLVARALARAVTRARERAHD